MNKKIIITALLALVTMTGQGQILTSGRFVEEDTLNVVVQGAVLAGSLMAPTQLAHSSVREWL